jgi:hypothetical protein
MLIVAIPLRGYCCHSTVQPTVGAEVVATGLVDFWVVGNEAGYFPSLVGPARQVLLGPAERYNIILDFSSIPGGALQQRAATDC